MKYGDKHPGLHLLENKYKYLKIASKISRLNRILLLPSLHLLQCYKYNANQNQKIYEQN